MVTMVEVTLVEVTVVGLRGGYGVVTSWFGDGYGVIMGWLMVMVMAYIIYGYKHI